MLRIGTAPYYECSTRGDKRFSAFGAVVFGKPIEYIYQAAKVFDDGTTGLDWRAAKGRKAVNAEYCAWLYERLWVQYIKEHPELMDVLQGLCGLQDLFGQPGSVCQAEVLWRIRNGELL